MIETGAQLGDGVGADARNPANYHPYAAAVADTFNSTSQMHFQSPTKLASMFVKGTVELPYDVRFTSTALFAERNSAALPVGKAPHLRATASTARLARGQAVK